MDKEDDASDGSPRAVHPSCVLFRRLSVISRVALRDSMQGTYTSFRHRVAQSIIEQDCFAPGGHPSYSGSLKPFMSLEIRNLLFSNSTSTF